MSTLFPVIIATATLAIALAAEDIITFEERSVETAYTSESTPFILFEDIPYLGNSRKEKMDIYLPENETDTPRPAILIIHGGGWATGSKNNPRARDFAHFMIDQGYAAISIDYRLTEYEGTPWRSRKIKGAWPDNLFDCKTALRFVKANATGLNIDPGRIGVMGGSAGGHLAMLIGLSESSSELNSGGLYRNQENTVRCIINFYGISDVRDWGGETFIDASRENNPEVWAIASPITHITSDSPPIFVTHGTADPTVDISQSDNLIELLQDKGVPYRYERIEGAVHSYSLQAPQKDLRPTLSTFLRTYLE